MSSTQSLVQSLQSSDVSVALEALQECLREVNPPLEVLVKIIPLCAHSNEELREHAVGVCESYEEFQNGSAAALAKLLPASKNDSAYWCATLLGRIGPDAAVAVPPLIDCLHNQSSIAARERAAWALGQIGSEASDAIGALKEAAKSADQRLSRVAQEAIDLIS
jgi:HEAT repeat protein